MCGKIPILMAVEDILIALGEKFVSNSARAVMFLIMFLVLRFLRIQYESRKPMESVSK